MQGASSWQHSKPWGCFPHSQHWPSPGTQPVDFLSLGSWGSVICHGCCLLFLFPWSQAPLALFGDSIVLLGLFLSAVGHQAASPFKSLIKISSDIKANDRSLGNSRCPFICHRGSDPGTSLTTISLTLPGPNLNFQPGEEDHRPDDLPFDVRDTIQNVWRGKSCPQPAAAPGQAPPEQTFPECICGSVIPRKGPAPLLQS